MTSRAPRAGVESSERGRPPAHRVRCALALVALAGGVSRLLCAMSGQAAVFGGLAGCQDPPAAAPARLWLGGDLHLGTAGAPAVDRLAPLAAVTRGAFGIVNLEGPVADDGAVIARGRLGNGAGLVAGLARAGVRVAGVANNHARDHGATGAARTLAALRASGVAPAGGAAGPATFDAGGARVVVVQADLSDGVPAGLGAELAAARTMGDVLIVTFHVTAPPSYLPPPSLRSAVEIAVATGAQVIAAHGSHALGAVERRGDVVIAWGLGNLLFHCDCTDEIDGAILVVDLARGGVRAAALVPIDAGLDGAAARPAARPALTFELLRSLRSSPIEIEGDRGWLMR